MFGNKMDKIAKLADKNDAVKLLGMPKARTFLLHQLEAEKSPEVREAMDTALKELAVKL